MINLGGFHVFISDSFIDHPQRWNRWVGQTQCSAVMKGISHWWEWRDRKVSLGLGTFYGCQISVSLVFARGEIVTSQRDISSWASADKTETMLIDH